MTTLQDFFSKPSPDEDIIGRIAMLDNSDITVTTWEADFIESVLQWESLTDKQRRVAKGMLDKYGF